MDVSEKLTSGSLGVKLIGTTEVLAAIRPDRRIKLGADEDTSPEPTLFVGMIGLGTIIS